MNNKTMGELICSLRKEKGMTQRELAEKLNVTDKAVSKWERDASYPDTGSLPALAEIHGIFLYRLIMIGFKLLLLPLVVSFSYEINRWVGRHDNVFTRILSAPGMWFQNFTTNEPDDGMIEVGITALEAVLPANEGEDLW